MALVSPSSIISHSALIMILIVNLGLFVRKWRSRKEIMGPALAFARFYILISYLYLVLFQPDGSYELLLIRAGIFLLMFGESVHMLLSWRAERKIARMAKKRNDDRINYIDQ
jgi:hypothetical protein